MCYSVRFKSGKAKANVPISFWAQGSTIFRGAKIASNRGKMDHHDAPLALPPPAGPPIGPVDAYAWNHKGRPHATLLVEVNAPFRVNLILLDWWGNVVRESGFHGTAWLDEGPRGEHRFTLEKFRFLGENAPWHHNNMVLLGAFKRGV